MKKFWLSMIVIVFVVVSSGYAVAAGTAEEAKELVGKAAAYVQANGKEAALTEFNNPKGQFVRGELYVFAYDMKGVIIANPVNPKLVGINAMELPDVDGKLFRKEGITLANKNGSAWVDYKYKNPKSGKVEQKTSYVMKAGDIVVGCGIYKP